MRQRRNDATPAAVDVDRRDGVRRVRIEWFLVDEPRAIGRAEQEGLRPAAERQFEAPGQYVRALLIGVAVQPARDDPAVVVLDPDRRAGRLEQRCGQLDDAPEDLVEAAGSRQLAAELEQCGGAVRLAAC